jgi:hypothetical protein
VERDAGDGGHELGAPHLHGLHAAGGLHHGGAVANIARNTSLDAVCLKKRGFEVRVDDVAGNGPSINCLPRSS